MKKAWTIVHHANTKIQTNGIRIMMNSTFVFVFVVWRKKIYIYISLSSWNGMNLQLGIDRAVENPNRTTE